MKFTGLDIHQIAAMNQSEPRFAWVTVNITFDHADTGTKPMIDLDVPVVYDENWTVDQIRREAYRLAKNAIDAAAQALGSGDPAELPRIYDQPLV